MNMNLRTMKYSGTSSTILDLKPTIRATDVNKRFNDYSEHDTATNFAYQNAIFTYDSIKRELPDVIRLAHIFLSFSAMPNKKLQKLCYYAQAWHLALKDEPLINDTFEAWVHGPVCPTLYHHYKSYGYMDIPKENIPEKTPEEFIEFAEEVYKAYGHLSAGELERLSHTEDPWIKARGDLKPWMACNNVIDNQSMKDYYRNKD